VAPSVARHRFALGLDVDLNYCVTAIRCDHGAIKPAQKLTRAQLVKWVREQVAAGHEVHTVYEACGFGYTLHEALVAAGAQSLITTPVKLSPERRRKNDRLDAREQCVRLARHLDGHAHELRPIRIPSAAERERRELGRQRNFWVREVRRLENHGRALRLEFEHETLPGNWAGPRTWPKLASECSAFVREQLEPVVAQIRAAKVTLAQLTARVAARGSSQPPCRMSISGLSPGLPRRGKERSGSPGERMEVGSGEAERSGVNRRGNPGVRRSSRGRSARWPGWPAEAQTRRHEHRHRSGQAQAR
jgi:transposase